MFNKLTNKEMEQLFCLQEELGEIIQAIGKILRHGYEEYSPYDETKTTNRQNLEREIGNANHWLNELCIDGKINSDEINRHSVEKAESCKPFMHHQNNEAEDNEAEDKEDETLIEKLETAYQFAKRSNDYPEMTRAVMGMAAIERGKEND